MGDKTRQVVGQSLTMSSGITLTRLFPLPSSLPSPHPSLTPTGELAKRCADRGISTAKDLFALTEMQLCDLLDLSLHDARVLFELAQLLLLLFL